MDKNEVIDGGIYERNDEIYLVEKVYDAKDGKLNPIRLVKFKVIDSMPGHMNIEKFCELYKPYDPEAD